MGKYAKVALIVGVLIFLFYPMLWAIQLYTLTELYSYYVEMIISLTGLNRYLANVVVVLGLIPALYGAKLYFFSFRDKTKANIGLAMLITVFIVYNIGLYFATKDVNIDQGGHVRKWCAYTPEGLRCFDHDGYDPKYMIKLMPMTPEMIEDEKRGKPQRIKYESVDDVEFFNSLTPHEAKVWYYRDQSGNFELFSGKGKHPVHGVMLQPVTPQAVSEIKASLARVVVKKEEGKKEAEANQTRLALKKEEENKKTEAQHALAEHKAFLSKYINTSASGTTKTHGVAILVLDDSGNVSTGMNQRISATLNAKAVTAGTSFFTHDFVRDGLFERLYSGNAELAHRLELKNHVGFLVLGKSNVSYKENPDMQGMTTGVVTLDIHIVSSQTGSIMESFSLSESGAGFTKTEAENQAMERISGKLTTTRWNALKSG